MSHWKSSAYWKSKISTAESDASTTWKEVNTLLSEDKSSTITDFSTQAIREATSSPAPPNLLTTNISSWHHFKLFVLMLSEYILRLLRSKHALDPGLTWLMKQCGDVLSPFITDIFNPLAAEFFHYPSGGTEIIFYKPSPGTNFLFQCLLFWRGFFSLILMFPGLRIYAVPPPPIHNTG